jgi:AcrR family transcriptional regulator
VKTQAPRRSESSRRAILDATLALIRERGLAALTVEGIAARAGVGKQTIYRWWPSKGVVAIDALLESAGPAIGVPRGADPWADLAELLGNVADLMADPNQGPHLAAILAQTQSDPAVALAFKERVFGPIRGEYRRAFEHLSQTGALSVDPDDLLDMAFGPLWFRLLTRPSQIDRGFALRVANQLRAASQATASASSASTPPAADPVRNGV